MQEASKYAVGIDIGTTTVRCVIGHIDETTGTPTIVGVGTVSNNGMRKGTVVNLASPAQAIDDALGEAERMSGYQVNGATININGTHILSTHTDGMIAVGNTGHEITPEDVMRIEEVATLGKVPANREILDVVPHAYKLDGQDNIKDPVGMTGTRLEVDAHVVSALAPHLNNLQKAAEAAKVTPNDIIVSGVAAARAVLKDNQMENGVALVDIGGSTTNVAVYEEGDLQYAGVIPIGGINITNDLAIGLKTDPSIAEELKLKHASAISRRDKSGVSLKGADNEIYSFQTIEMDEIVEARLEEIFEGVNRELKRAGRAGRLPNGVVLTGGTANLKGITDYAKEALGLSATVGIVSGLGGVADNIEKPDYATVIGLMLIDAQDGHNKKGRAKNAVSEGVGILSRFMNRFRA